MNPSKTKMSTFIKKYKCAGRKKNRNSMNIEAFYDSRSYSYNAEVVP